MKIKCAVVPQDYDRLAGQVVKVSASREADPGFKSRTSRDFSGSSHTRDLNIGTPVATLPGAWCFGVSAGQVDSVSVSVYCDWVRKFDLELLSHCSSTYNFLGRTVREIH